MVTLDDFGASAGKVNPKSNPDEFLSSVIQKAKETGSQMQLLKHYSEEPTEKQLSIHKLVVLFLQKSGNNDADAFCNFASTQMSIDVCQKACIMTTEQSDSKLWHDLRYARVTASKIYEFAKCKTAPGSLIESVTGGIKIKETNAMKRGKLLEKKVLQTVEKLTNINFKATGLLISPGHPLLGASPDGISEQYVLEIKCPSKEKTVCLYIKNGEIVNKCKAQIQLQMHLFGKQKGIFCVADPFFETNGKVSLLYVDYDQEFTENLIEAAEAFWKENIFPFLLSSFKKH